MGLPKIKFNISADGLGRLGAGVQKVPALVISGNTVASKVTLGKSYQLFSLKEAEDLGIESTGTNAFAYKHIKDFYAQVNSGAELWVMLVSDATTMTQMADKTENYAKKLVTDAKGKVRVLGIIKKSNGSATITDGLDVDSHTAVAKAQELGKYFEEKYMPIRVIISGNDFSGTVASLKDYTTTNNNKVLMLIANNDGEKEASVGLTLGRLASVPTQRSIARVKDGAIVSKHAYFTSGEIIETLQDAWDSIHDKGYTFFRDFQGKSGYYLTDDQTLTASTDDYSSMARGLVMDEVQMIAYTTMINELSDEVPVEDGKIHPAIIKTWQSNIEGQIQGQMVSQGKLSGFSAVIDPNQNVLQTDKIVMSLYPLPVGYAKTIEINLGFSTN